MERFILFPKNEFRYFNEGIKYYNGKMYEKAISFFEKAEKIKYLKKDCIKYLIECHIELHHFDEVYRMIENEFVDKNLDEEYLLKKYLYTMVLEEQYIEASELINIYKHNKNTSKELKQYLDDLVVMIDEKLDKQNNTDKQDMMKYFLSNDFEDHIQIILNLDSIDIDKYKIEINDFLNNPEIDSFIKYNLLKYIMENKLTDRINYRNYYDEPFVVSNDSFVDILTDEFFYQPIDNVLQNLNKETIAKEFIKNIWLDFSVKYYPHLIHDIGLASAVLHVLILKTMNEKCNISAISDLYDIESKRLFNYFKM